MKMSAMISRLMAVAFAFVTMTVVVAESSGCSSFNSTGNLEPQVGVTRSLKLWQGVLLIVSFGVFGLLVAFVHRLVRAYVFYDNHLLDTYFDAGGEVNFAMVACSVVAKRLWTASYTFSTTDVFKFGLVGHFWYSAAGVIHLLLFAIVASEIRTKAPGARTFLQVIRSRFGPVPHVIVMISAFITNIIIIGLVMAEGTRILTWLCQNIDQYVVCVILTIAVGLYTLIGGVGGTMYMAYFCVSCVVAIYIVYFTDTAFNSLKRPDYRFVHFFDEARDAVYCSNSSYVPSGPEFGSLLTFRSTAGLLEGIIFALAGFSSVFVNQGFWLTAISAKPAHSVWGYLTGALVWFAVPFIFSFVFGMGYWTLASREGTHLVNSTQAALGILPVIVSQQLMGRFGDFMMYSLTLAVVLTSVSNEILSISSIIIYDVIQTYIYPFSYSDVAVSQPSPCDATCGSSSSAAVFERKKAAGGVYLRYNSRCITAQWVTVLLVSILVYPIALIVLAIGMQLQWLFNFLGVVVGSSVFPIVLSIVWHRTTAAAVAAGVLCGFASGISSWLIYASRFDHGLDWFQGNTGRQEVFIVGLAFALGIGGIVCVFVSLTCGGCDPHRSEEEEWEKCRSVDNPVLPWAVRYSSDFSSVNRHTGLPHFYALRRTFKTAELSAYVIGVLLSLSLALVWPALMLLSDVFDTDVFRSWAIMVFVWAVVAGFFICVIPLLYEVIDTCCVSYNIRLWKNRLDETRVEKVQTMSTVVQSVGTAHRRYAGTMQSSHRVMRFADVSARCPDVRPHRAAADFAVTDYTLYPSSTCARNSSGWQTLVHLD